MNRAYFTVIGLLVIYIKGSIQLYHEPSMQIFSGPNLLEDSYFGYSLTYEPNMKSLMVGAPKADKIGQVYTIHIDSSIAEQNTTLTALAPLSNLKKAYKKLVDVNMFGATVQAGPQVFVMCTPRHTQKEVLNMKEVKVTSGLCFRFTILQNRLSLMRMPYLPSSDNIESRMMTYGWSLGVTSTSIVIVGAPALGAGRAYVYQHVMAQRPPKELTTPNATKFNFGYSVAYGNFFDNERVTTLYYAISTTYGSTGSGKVYFFLDSTKSLVDTIDDDEVGTMFGATLCTVNLGKRRDSLLVGAPAYSEDFQVDRGAVYLYLPGRIRETFKIIKGKSDGAYFGSAIANLGDMDGDRKEEVAIGAPYENEGLGAVYIYSGAGLFDPSQQGDQMLIQRIEPQPKNNLRAFGFSLSALRSFDANGCNDLAVGAPHSNKAVLFKCFPSITVQVQAIFPTNIKRKKNEKSETYFIFQSCFNVEYPEKLGKIETSIDVKVQIAHPYAKLNTKNNETSLKYKVLLKRDQTLYCQDVEVLTPEDGNYNELLLYKISASLLDDFQSALEFGSSRVIISKQSKLSVDGVQSIAFRNEGDAEPKPILSIDINTHMLAPYTVGSSTNESFSFTVHNAGDTAYTPCIFVQVNGTRVLRPPQGCIYEGADLICTTNVALNNESDWITGNIILDTTRLTSKDRDINITYALFTNCNTRFNASNNKSYEVEQIILVNDMRGVKVKGESDPAAIVDLYSESSQAHHMFTISNDGVTNWVDVSIQLSLTKNKFVKYYDSIFKVIGDKFIPCENESETEDQLHFTCNRIDLQPNDRLKLSIPFEVLPDKNGKNETIVYEVISNLTVILDIYNMDNNIFSSIVTTLQCKNGRVPTWIIVTACLIGLLIVLIIVLVLYKLGWLRRKKKQELNNLRKSVYRQSQNRQLMKTPASSDNKTRQSKSTFMCDNNDEPLH